MKKLLEVQKEIGTLSKNAKNPFFKSQYLDLNTLLQHVTPLLNSKGLLLLQSLRGNEVNSIIVDTETDEEVAISSIALPNIADPQKLGSAITYFRRYTLKSLLAISEEDDDGNKAGKPVEKVKPHLTTSSTAFKGGLEKGTSIEVMKRHFSIDSMVEDEYNKQLKENGSK